MQLKMDEGDTLLVVDIGSREGTTNQQIIVDRLKGDIRITDFSHIITVRLQRPEDKKLMDILVDDVFVKLPGAHGDKLTFLEDP